MTTIRPIEAKDESRWRELWEGYNQYYERTIPEEATALTFKRMLDPKVELYGAVAEEPDGQLSGFVTWMPHIYTGSVNDIVYLHDLFVDPNVRNKGTGRKLMEYCFAEAEKAGACKVYWLTQHFNHRAQLLYTKVGEKTPFVHYTHNFGKK